MARLEVAQNLRIHILELADYLRLALVEAEAVYSTRRQIDLTYDGGTISLYGFFEYDAFGFLVGGNIGKVEDYPNSGAWVIMSQLGLDVGAVLTAIAAGGTALEDLVYSLDWTLIGAENQDFLYDTAPVSFAGNDYVKLGADDDNFFGGAGDDTVLGESDNDELYGGTGNDHLLGGNGRDTIEGNHGNDLIEGGGGKDRLSGGVGHDTIKGGDGHDNIAGGRSNDWIEGGRGNDKLSGGADADTFYFNMDEIEGDSDRVVDFEVDVDVIHIHNMDQATFQVGGDNNNTVLTQGTTTITIEGVSVLDFISNQNHAVYTGDDWA